MKFEYIDVFNFKNALRGMRNPKESWNLSDSYFGICSEWAVNDIVTEIGYNWLYNKYPEAINHDCLTDEEAKYLDQRITWLWENGINTTHSEEDLYECTLIGPKDMKLAQTLIKAGSEHRKFMRQIFVSVDITAPLFFYKEFDTYKVATVANSTSTMHKLTSKPITLDCFEIDDYDSQLAVPGDAHWHLEIFWDRLINRLEELRQATVNEVNPTLKKKYWKELIRLLPESWLQTRTWTCNYENLLGICSKGQRRNHKLTEWSKSFIDFARSLPYAQELIFIDELE